MSSAPEDRQDSPGAYGLAFRGLEESPLLPPAAPAWPLVTIARELRYGKRSQFVIERERATVPVGEAGHAVIDRRDSTVTVIHEAALTTEDLVHPMLARVGRVFSRWLGRHAFHAGVVAVDGGAWGLIGAADAGKSTLLAALALAGCGVIADDALIVGDGRAFAGPRCIDLREPAPSRLGVLDRVTPVHSRRRHRLTLPRVASEVPLRGWIYLAWGDSLTVEAVDAHDRVDRLARECGWPMDGNPHALLDFSALPAYELRRPRGWELVPDAVEAVLGAASASAAR